PAYGAFLGARRFQTGTGVEHFSDLKEMGATSDMQPDRFYFDQALRVIERERGKAPLFIFVYVAANHFPWTSTFRPDLTRDWTAPGTAPPVDEYIHERARLFRLPRAPRARLSARIVFAGAVRRSPARHLGQAPRAHDRSHRGGAAHHAGRSPLFQHLLRHRRGQLPAVGPVVGARADRGALPSAGRAGGRPGAARSELRRAQEGAPALQRPVLPLQPWCRGAPLQPAADRRRPDQGIVAGSPIGWNHWTRSRGSSEPGKGSVFTVRLPGNGNS